MASKKPKEEPQESGSNTDDQPDPFPAGLSGDMDKIEFGEKLRILVQSVPWNDVRTICGLDEDTKVTVPNIVDVVPAEERGNVIMQLQQKGK